MSYLVSFKFYLFKGAILTLLLCRSLDGMTQNGIRQEKVGHTVDVIFLDGTQPKEFQMISQEIVQGLKQTLVNVQIQVSPRVKAIVEETLGTFFSKSNKISFITSLPLNFDEKIFKFSSVSDDKIIGSFLIKIKAIKVLPVVQVKVENSIHPAFNQGLEAGLGVLALFRSRNSNSLEPTQLGELSVSTTNQWSAHFGFSAKSTFQYQLTSFDDLSKDHFLYVQSAFDVFLLQSDFKFLKLRAGLGYGNVLTSANVSRAQALSTSMGFDFGWAQSQVSGWILSIDYQRLASAPQLFSWGSSLVIGELIYFCQWHLKFLPKKMGLKFQNLDLPNDSDKLRYLSIGLTSRWQFW